jgi:hypothetical protein
MALLSAGLAAACWLPGMALAKKGPRAQGIPDEWANIRSFPPVRLLELIAPHACGDISALDDRKYFGWRLYPKRLWPFYWGLYGGVLFLPFVVIGMTGKTRRIRLLALPALISFLVALGPAGLLWSAARRFLRPWKGIRYPEKFLAMTFFCLIPLVALGFDRLRRSPRWCRRCAFLLAAAGASALAAELSGSGASLLPWVDSAAVPPILLDAGLRLLFGSIILLALGWLASAHRARPLWTGLCLLALIAEILGVSREMLHTRSALWMDQPPPVIRRLLTVKPALRLVDHLPPWPLSLDSGLHQPGGDFDRNRVLFTQPVQWGIPLALDLDFDVTYVAATDRARDLMVHWGLKDAQVFSRLVAGRGAGAVLNWKEPFTLEDPVGLLGIPNRRPEVDSEISVRRFRGDEGFFEATRSDANSLPQTALIEGKDFPGIPDFPAPAEISAVVARNDSLELCTRSTGTALLRIARTNDGNWHALLDGKPWRVANLDISLIGLQIPPGSHTVRLYYRDQILRLGMAISLATLLGLLLLVFFRPRPRDKIRTE